MLERTIPAEGTELDNFVAAFETARSQNGPLEIAAFLPDPTHPCYREVLRELVRIDLEYGWTRGQPTNLEDYRQQFPQLFLDPEDLQAITFEEYRLRRQAGDHPHPEDYQRHFGVDTRLWPVEQAPACTRDAPFFPGSNDRFTPPLHEVPRVTGDWTPPSSCTAKRIDDMPEVGGEFLDFHLKSELGRGAFARVFLALQGELADRCVVLKISRDIVGESHTLAQLQHTNIVPIYSIHHAGSFHAVCMPFFGPTTLADVLSDLRQQSALPASGKALVATVNACKSNTRLPGPSAIAQQPSPAHGQTDTGTPPLADCDAPLVDGRQSAAGGHESIAPSLATLAGLNYVEAVLWIAARLAEGLAHAHERGILHRDLKPANILLANDGQPMLLDFNLSEDIKLRSHGAGTSAIGGTLPYMSPEHLAAFQDKTCTVDARSDVYSLGIILFEMLGGTHPYPLHHHQPLREVLPRMLQDRQKPPPGLCRANSAVSPAVESIILHCLETDPKRRYQSAEALKEDLERHLQNLPLCHAREPSFRERGAKWVRRHPRLTSISSVAAMAFLFLLGLGAMVVAREERLARLEAAESFNLFRQDMRAAQVGFLEAPTTGRTGWARIEAACRQALDRFQVLDNPAWQTSASFRRLSTEDQEHVRADAGELLFLLAAMARLQDPQTSHGDSDRRLRVALALNQKAASYYADGRAPAAVVQQRAVLDALLGQPEQTMQHFIPAQQRAMPATARDCCMLACLHMAQGHRHKSLALWHRATFLEPQNVWTWYGLGSCYDSLARYGQAAACYSACIALSPEFAGWYGKRGLDYLKISEFALAGADFDRASELQPGQTEALVNRALARLGANRYEEAKADLTAALDLGSQDVRVYFLRAEAREKLGDLAGAQRDRDAGLLKEPADEAAWIARGVSRIAKDPPAALADFDQALKANPRSLTALENKAHVLAEKLNKVDESVHVLDRAVALHPEQGSLRAARGVLLARLGKRQAALQDAAAALELDSSGVMTYQVAGIYALTSRQNPDDKLRAVSLLAAALRQGFGEELLDGDRDLDPIRLAPEFQHLMQAVHTLRDQAGKRKQ